MAILTREVLDDLLGSLPKPPDDMFKGGKYLRVPTALKDSFKEKIISSGYSGGGNIYSLWGSIQIIENEFLPDDIMMAGNFNRKGGFDITCIFKITGEAGE